MKSRLFRALICLLVICCLLVNISPIKAEATAVVAGALTFEGLMAALFSMSIGIVAVDLTVQTWNKIGEDLGEEIANADPSIAEAWVDVEALYNSYGPDDDDPEDALEWAEKLKHALSRGLLGAIAGWLCTLVNMGGYEVEGDEAMDGYWYYNGQLFASLASYDPDNYWYIICKTNIFTSGALLRHSASSGFYYDSSSSTIYPNSGTGQFKYSTGIGSEPTGSKSKLANAEIFWTSHDLYDNSGNLIMAGSDPTTSKTEIIEPTIYVGDIPQQIQNGDKDENNLDLPIIDPFRVIQSPETALDDVNQLQQQLMNGTTTLDEYLQHVQLQEPTVDPDPTTDPSESTTPSMDPSEPDEDNRDNGAFTLDLTDFFPFCIPFDIYEFLSLLAADPVAPVFNWKIEVPQLGQAFEIDVDLSPWDEVAALFRKLELFGFIIGLAYVTRKSYLRG